MSHPFDLCAEAQAPLGSDLERLAFVHDAVVHSRHGLITSLIEQPELPAAPSLFVYTGIAAEAAYFRENERTQPQDARSGSGASFDRAAAIWAAIGECLERYCAFIHLPDQVQWASELELGQRAVGLDRYILFGTEQYLQPSFPFAPPDRSLPRAWVQARVLGTAGESRFVPASLVFLGMALRSQSENIAQNTSSGLSCASTFLTATETGLYELIEREAFAATWQLRRTPTRLLLSDELASRLNRGVSRALSSRTTEITMWDITSDLGVPVVLAMARGHNGELIAFGASAHVRVEQAIEKAVVEALHALVWGAQLSAFGKRTPAAQDVRAPADHFMYHFAGEHLDELRFLLESPESTALPRETRDSFVDVVQRLRSKGYEPVAVDLTTADVASLGLSVVRVLVPGLHPLLFGYGVSTTDTRRLREIAAFWGVTDIGAPNPSPHPFP